METSLGGEKFDERIRETVDTAKGDHSVSTSNNVESPKSAGLALPRRSKPMLKSQKLLEHGLMARILPKGDEEMLGNLATMDSLDSQLQSFCLSSLTLNSWLGESLDPTLTVESFGLSMHDTISREFPRDDRMRSKAASSLDFANPLVSTERASHDFNDDPEDLSIAQTREEFVHPELVSLEPPQSTLHSQAYSEHENLSIKQTGHEFAEIELLPNHTVGRSIDTEQTVLIDSEPSISLGQSSQEYSDPTHTGSVSVTSPHAAEAMEIDQATPPFCYPKTPTKKKLGVIRRLICGCTAGSRKKWTDKDVQNIVDRHSSRKMDRETVDSARDDSDDSLDSHLLGQRGPSRMGMSEAERARLRSSSRRSALGAGVHKDKGRERHHSVSSLEQARIRRMLKDSNLKEHVPEFQWNAMPKLQKFELTDIEWARYWRFNGTWTLDRELSDRQDGSLAYVWQLTASLRRTIDGLDRLLIDSTPSLCRTSLSAHGVRGIQEQRPWNGDIVRCERRDGRNGFMMIWVEPTQKSFTARMEWGEPYPGHAAETYELSKDGQLLFVIREIQRRDKSDIRAQIRSVFRRQA